MRDRSQVTAPYAMDCSRREFIAGGSVVLLNGVERTWGAEVELPRELEIIDCHTHFYDPTRPEGVPWPGKGSSLYRPVLPRHLRAQPMYRPITGTVVVEASPRVEDNAWLLELARQDPFLVGVVGSLDPRETAFSHHVRRFAADRLFRGIRISVRVAHELLQQQSVRRLQPLLDHDLSLDVNGGPETPAAVAALAQELPGLPIVLNHIGNVRITSAAPPTDWQAGIRAAGKLPNVYCKISALVEGAAGPQQTAPSDLAFYRPYLDVVWNAFGAERVIYGSNWPVSERAADYQTLQRLSLTYIAEKDPTAVAKFCALNAQRAYRWVDRPGRR